VEELQNKIKDLANKIKSAIADLDINSKQQVLQDLKEQMSAPSFWNDQETAKSVSTKASNLQEQVDDWLGLENQIKDLQDLLADKQAEDLLADINKNFVDIETKYNNLSQTLFWQGKYDDSPAIMTINAGAGGVDAQDWAQMLERMYLRFAEQKNWTTKVLSRSAGSEAGLKSVTIKISGSLAYGHLKHEKGVHRLVRLSPYDADHARHTSFAMVEILPEIIETDIIIKDEDLKIDTFRASGHGGQSVNTTDSAVRITHLPTGLVAICQNERSQLQNKRQAMTYLQSKLQQYHEAEQEDEKKALKGEYTTAAWGNQIRSYVLHPYKMIKDHRNNFEVKDPDKILDGDLMPFIQARLEQTIML
jgi:peptide chain release factor 2